MTPPSADRMFDDLVQKIIRDLASMPSSGNRGDDCPADTALDEYRYELRDGMTELSAYGWDSLIDNLIENHLSKLSAREQTILYVATDYGYAEYDEEAGLDSVEEFSGPWIQQELLRRIQSQVGP